MTTYDQIVTPADWLCASCGQPRGAHACLGGFQRRKIRFAAMLRIRNEARWIAEVLESIRPLCQRIFIMDDHSTDDTATICESFRLGADQHEQVTVLPSPFDGLNESRDKNWLYDQIMRECEPEWILCIDGDEVLEARGPEIIQDACIARAAGNFYHDRIDSYKLKIAYLWNSRHVVRVDRIYDDFWRPSLFRPFVPDPDKPDDMLVAQEFRFKSTPWGHGVNGVNPNFHCSSVPQRRIHGAKMLPARLKHYGYMWREDRVKKLDYLTSVDWKNDAEDWYRHVCQGDYVVYTELPRVQEMLKNGVLTHADTERLRNVSASDVLVHAGPLRLEPWDESKPWEMSAWARSQ
jgi:glycosyltransferase involved in cell wall biosynthesis